MVQGMVQGYVYIIKFDFGVYKIGRTKNLQSRFKQLSILPMGVALVHSIACENDAKVEKELHERFNEILNLRT